jgi:hypothetical protein
VRHRLADPGFLASIERLLTLPTEAIRKAIEVATPAIKGVA